MAETGRLTRAVRRRLVAPGHAGAHRDHRGWSWWRGRRLAASGLLFRDVVPVALVIGRALVELLADQTYYWHLGVTAGEVGTALVIGGLSGLAVGLALGANRFLADAFERYLYYLGPTPKIIFFPVMIMWFGVGPASKVAMGTMSCFFPVVLSAAGRHAPDRPGADPRRPQLPRQHLADGDQDLSAGDARADRQRRAARALASPSSARCWPRPSCPTAASAS